MAATPVGSLAVSKNGGNQCGTGVKCCFTGISSDFAVGATSADAAFVLAAASPHLQAPHLVRIRRQRATGVADVAWIADAVSGFSLRMPGGICVFALSETGFVRARVLSPQNCASAEFCHPTTACRRFRLSAGQTFRES